MVAISKELKKYCPEIVKYANGIARSSGRNKATAIIFGKENKIISHKPGQTLQTKDGRAYIKAETVIMLKEPE